MIHERENGRLLVRSLDYTQSQRSLHLLRNNKGCIPFVSEIRRFTPARGKWLLLIIVSLRNRTAG